MLTSRPRIIPDLYAPDVNNSNPSPTKDGKKSDTKSKKPEDEDTRATMFEIIHKFTVGRRAYKKRIIQQVMDAAYPNIEGASAK